MFPSWFSKQAFRTSTFLFYAQIFQFSISQSLYSNEGVLATQIPFLAPTLTPNTLYDWNYTTTAQPGFNGRSVPFPRGRILGGSSSVSKSSYRLSSRCVPCHCDSHPIQITRHTYMDPPTTSIAMHPTPEIRAGTGTTCRNISKRFALTLLVVLSLSLAHWHVINTHVVPGPHQ
jgi:GMC oxidoreductase